MRPASGLIRAAVVAVGFVAIAYCTSRTDLLALAAPFAVAALIGVLHLRDAAPMVSVMAQASEITEGDAVVARFDVVASGDVDALEILIETRDFVPADDEPTHWITMIDRESPTSFEMACIARRFGRLRIGLVHYLAHGHALLSVGDPGVTSSPVVLALPMTEQFRASSLVPHPRAHAGEHRSRFVAPGFDFAGIRLFTFGDALRRVNWKASARTSRLQVTSTFAEGDTEVIVVIDATRNAGPAGSSAIDVAVRATCALVEYYLKSNDVVRVIEICREPRDFLVRGGRRQFHDVRRWLAHVGERQGAAVDGPTQLGSLIPRNTRALVVVLSAMLEPSLHGELADLRRRGVAVVALDTLRDEMLPNPRTDAEMLARRLWSLERTMLLARLSRLGVPAVPWLGGGELDMVLRQVAMLAAAPRVTLR
jgi:uncharacterized protein (DUF58 family)